MFQFKITLNDSQPPIWRRIQMLETATFLDLHNAIQDAMGWEDYHLHEFAFESKTSKRPVLIGKPGEDSAFRVLPENKECIKDWFGVKSKQCIYTYDFGDSWDHTVLFEKALPVEPGMEYPRCVAGKRACPPEDSGGMWGYTHNLEVIKDPNNPEYAETVEWMGDEFDPNEFELEAVEFFGSEESDESESCQFDHNKFANIDSVEGAMFELDHAEGAIPFEAITYLRNTKSSKELIDHIEYVLENAYDDSLVVADVLHESSPLWYAVVAEAHLDERLIAPTIRLLVNTSDDWDFLNEQAQHLICLLAEKYPDKVAKATMQAIDAALELRLVSPYLYLFDVFMVVDSTKYQKWLLKVMVHRSNMWCAPFAHMLADIHLDGALPVLEELVKQMRAGDKPERAGLMPYNESNDIEEALNILKGIQKPYVKNPQPEYKNRGDWQQHYKKFADRFADDDEDEELLQNLAFNMPYIAPSKPGRNDPCDCGSGQKYKKCHGFNL